ncbi:MAG: L,D-transpeptidase [Verrucomicrobiales bacterium]|nr:L,D-transpeptidase [Verrucomicrobiales bacterium]
MSQPTRSVRSLVLALAGCLVAFGAVSCTTPTTGSVVRSAGIGPSNARIRPAGFPARSEGQPVVNTTRENFFTWLFSLDADAPTAKKPTKPTGPVIPPVKVNSAVLARSNKANTRIIVDISRQKAFLLVSGSVAIETPISTARPGKYTPRGSFRISERVRSGKISTIYGVGMPYWMRLSGSVYGVHAGYLPGYPASAGCVRLPSDAAQMIFDNTKHGTPVAIYSSWDGA